MGVHAQATLVKSPGRPKVRDPQARQGCFLWVVDICCLVFRWAVDFSFNCPMASTHTHDLSMSTQLPLVCLKCTQETATSRLIMLTQFIHSGNAFVRKEVRVDCLLSLGSLKGKWRRQGKAPTFAREPPGLCANADAPAILIVLGRSA